MVIKLNRVFTTSSAVWMVILITTITTLFGYFALTGTTYSVDFERYYPRENEQIQFYETYKKAFLDSSERTIVAVKTDKSVFNPHVLKEIEKLTDSLLSLKNVNAVSSITNANYLSYSSIVGIIQFPYVHPQDPEMAERDSQYIVDESELVGTYIAQNHHGFCIQILGKYALSNEEAVVYKNDLTRVLRNCGFNDFYLGGRIIGQKHILDTMQREMILFTLLSMCVVLIVLGFIYKTVWGLAGPLLVIGVTTIWTLGIMAILHIPLGLFSSIIPAILFVIGTSDVVHILHKYIDELRLGLNKSESLINAYREVGKATFLTTLTTIIGFLTLLTSSIVPIREFGIFAAAGVGIAFLLTYTLFPAFLLLTPIPKITTSQNGVKTNVLLTKCYYAILRNKPAVLICFGVAMTAGVWTASNLKADNYLTEELPDNDRFKKGFNYIEKNYSGLRSFEVAITIKDTNKTAINFTSPKILKEIDTLTQYINSSYAANSVYSIATVVRRLYEAKTGESLKDNVVSDNQLNFVSREVKSALRTKNARLLVNKELQMSRVSGLVKDIGGHRSVAKDKDLEEFAQVNCPSLNITVTGMSHLIDQNNKRIVRDMVEGLIIAFFLVSLLIAFIYKSFKIVLIALIPNLIPLLAVTILMYVLKINLNVSTALIFAIAFGITVDDTIHFLSKLKLELDKGETLSDAIENTFVTTGKAIIITSIILFLGFIVLALSSFTSNYYFGVLVSLTIVFAVLSDLLVLPVLLQWKRTRNK